MEKFLGKKRIVGFVLLGVAALVLALHLLMLHIGLYGKYDQNYTIWTLSKFIDIGADYAIYCVALIVLTFISIIPFCVCIYSAIRKNLLGFYIYALYGYCIEFMLLLFQVIYSTITPALMVMCFVNILLMIGTLYICVQSRKVDEGYTLKKEKEDVIIPFNKKFFLIIDIIAVCLLGLVFLIPLYQTNNNVVSLIFVLGGNNDNLENGIFFLVMFILFMATFTYFVFMLASYFYDKIAFAKKSKNLLILSAASAFIFFLIGFIVKICYSVNKQEVLTIAYIPLILLIVPIVLYSICIGKMGIKEECSNPVKLKRHKLEPLLYVMCITCITFVSIFFNVVKIDFKSSFAGGTFGSTINLTGIKILSDYSSLGAAYQVIAFLLIVMLVSSGIAFVLTLSSFFAKHPSYKKIAKTTIYINFAFVFLFAISGFYFTIAQEINKANVLELVEYYFNYTAITIDYTAGTDMVYALVVDVVILVIIYIRHAFEVQPEVENEKPQAEEPSKLATEPNIIIQEVPKETEEEKLEEPVETIAEDFDSCEAFTELDSLVPSFASDLEHRKLFNIEGESLNDLIEFVVSYARNCRLHLSYKPEDIATFVAGLGSTRLSILQGMSGTGKTSLPKIFAEAIYGNCEIIEVESSWKDKNELLGYYNEFSQKFTPKKFTQALYKACLNREIPTFIVLDEMNLSRIEYYFSDFLSLMENEENNREIKLVNIKLERTFNGEKYQYNALSNGHTLKIPANIWFIGTANRDESTFVISDKVYDRANTMNFNKRAPKVTSYNSPISKRFYSYEKLSNLLTSARINGRFNAEENTTIKKVEEILEPYNISFGNRILNQIEAFVNIYKACFIDHDATEEAVETILLSKVVSKLEVKVIENKDKLVHKFEEIGLNKCASFVNKLNED